VPRPCSAAQRRLVWRLRFLPAVVAGCLQLHAAGAEHAQLAQHQRQRHQPRRQRDEQPPPAPARSHQLSGRGSRRARGQPGVQLPGICQQAALQGRMGHQISRHGRHAAIVAAAAARPPSPAAAWALLPAAHGRQQAGFQQAGEHHAGGQLRLQQVYQRLLSHVQQPAAATPQQPSQQHRP